MKETDETLAILARAKSGDRDALGALLGEHESRLLRMIELRLDARLRARVDPRDVLQAVFTEVVRRLDEFQADGRLPFFLWLRLLVAQEIALQQRRNLGAQARDPRREVPIPQMAAAPSADSVTDFILSRDTSPSQAVAREESRARVREAVLALDPLDREILVLRHFEQLSNHEAALELDIEPAAASKRYLRALERARPLLRSSLGTPSESAS